MNKTALSLMMLRILKTRPLIKKKELADLLETNPRNIIEFKKELETAGYEIETVNGPNGGYRLKDKSLLIVPELTSMEISSLQEVLAYLNSAGITLKKDAESALEKVLSVSLLNENVTDIYASGTKLAISADKLQRIYETIRVAVEKKRRLKVAYKPQNKEIYNWTVHPYGLFLYNGMWYLVAYRENDHEVTLKLNRIENIEITDIPFSVPADFNIAKYSGEYGINIGTDNHLKAIIKNRYYLSEYIYGENQRIETIDDHTILLEVDLANEMSMKSFVMELGSDCEILEPEWLKDYVSKEAEKVINIYK